MPASSSDRLRRHLRSPLLALLLGASVAACGGRDFVYRSEREIPPGPGLFTGEAGTLTVGLGGTAAERRTGDGPAEGLPAARPPTGGYTEP